MTFAAVETRRGQRIDLDVAGSNSFKAAAAG